MTVKQTISEVVMTTANAKVAALTGVGITAPAWVEYLELVINPIAAGITAIAAALYMIFKAINAFCEWYFIDWKRRKEQIKRRK